MRLRSKTTLSAAGSPSAASGGETQDADHHMEQPSEEQTGLVGEVCEADSSGLGASSTPDDVFGFQGLGMDEAE